MRKKNKCLSRRVKGCCWLSKSLSHNYNLLTAPNKLLLFVLSKLFTKSKHIYSYNTYIQINTHLYITHIPLLLLSNRVHTNTVMPVGEKSTHILIQNNSTLFIFTNALPSYHKYNITFYLVSLFAPFQD